MSNDNMKEPKRGPGPGRGPLGRGQGINGLSRQIYLCYNCSFYIRYR